MKHYKKDFPIFHQSELVYCDNAATSQKPHQVLERIMHFYSKENATIYRGLYKLAEKATEEYEYAREKVVHYIGAEYGSEVVFTHGATAGINIVASSWACHNLSEHDEIVITELEHHSNILPWLEVAKVTGARVRWIHVLQNGELDLSNLEEIITAKTKLVAVSDWSNVTGVPIRVEPILMRAHAVGARVLLDASQSAPRRHLRLRERGFDFAVFSGHKMLGPTGVGVLFVKQEIHSFMVPVESGGGMVFSVAPEKVVWRDVPYRLEAGTPPIAQVIGLGAAIDYLEAVDFDELKIHEAALCAELIAGLQNFKQIKIIGPVERIQHEGHAVTFIVDGMHAHDIAAHCDKYNIALRAGNHCAQVLHEKLHIGNSVRVSFYLYNTKDDVEKILVALQQLLG